MKVQFWWFIYCTTLIIEKVCRHSTLSIVINTVIRRLFLDNCRRVSFGMHMNCVGIPSESVFAKRWNFMFIKSDNFSFQYVTWKSFRMPFPKIEHCLLMESALMNNIGDRGQGVGLTMSMACEIFRWQTYAHATVAPTRLFSESFIYCHFYSVFLLVCLCLCKCLWVLVFSCESVCLLSLWQAFVCLLCQQ